MVAESERVLQEMQSQRAATLLAQCAEPFTDQAAVAAEAATHGRQRKKRVC